MSVCAAFAHPKHVPAPITAITCKALFFFIPEAFMSFKAKSVVFRSSAACRRHGEG